MWTENCPRVLLHSVAKRGHFICYRKKWIYICGFYFYKEDVCQPKRSRQHKERYTMFHWNTAEVPFHLELFTQDCHSICEKFNLPNWTFNIQSNFSCASTLCVEGLPTVSVFFLFGSLLSVSFLKKFLVNHNFILHFIVQRKKIIELKLFLFVSADVI